ncbi:MAG: acyl-CoA dehydrogenase family protein [Alphaproteobacteria bacterium]|nr:acyl-CoA dehydrogenase family protein [Alphaproteobacteria bacterium]
MRCAQFGLTREQQSLKDQAADLAARVAAPSAAETDRAETYPWAVVEAMTEAGFMGYTLPKAYGGQGGSYLDAALIVEELAKVCGVSGRIAVEANMGGVAAIMRYGTDAQRRLAAELVLAGDKPAICITEPDAGSAATEMLTRADKRGDVYILNGSKHWITGGGVSKLHLIFARVFDEAGEEQGINGFIAIRGETPGLRIGAREPTMGLRGIPETEIFFEEMEIPADWVVIPPGGFRRGFAQLMDAYNSQRVGAGTVALGIAAGAYETALSFTQEREQFGRPICEFQGLQWMLADMSIQLEAARMMLWRAAASATDPVLDGLRPFPDATQAAQAKIFASEMAIKVTNDALQLHGAAGYSRNNPLERMARDARMFTIGGGTAQILRTVVASRLLDRKLPQTRAGQAQLDEPAQPAASIHRPSAAAE